MSIHKGKKIRHLTVPEYGLPGVQLIKPGLRPDLTPRGFNFNFPTGIPPPIIFNENHSHPKLEPRDVLLQKKGKALRMGFFYSHLPSSPTFG